MKVSCVIGSSSKQSNLCLAVYITAQEYRTVTGSEYSMEHRKRVTIRSQLDDWFSVNFDNAGSLGLYPATNTNNSVDPHRSVCQTKTNCLNLGLKSPRLNAMPAKDVKIQGNAIWFRLPREFYINTMGNLKSAVGVVPVQTVTKADKPIVTDTTVDTLRLAIAQVNALYKKINDTGSSELKLSVVDGKLKAQFMHVVEI